MAFDFDEQVDVVEPAVFRGARVSPTRGNRVRDELIAAGRIKPVKTPTGRRIYSVNDARRLFNALTEQA